MFERIYPSKIILPMKMHYGVPAIPAVNVGDYVRIGQCVGVPEKGFYKEIFNSDAAKYAGSNRVNTRQVRAKKKPMHGMPYSITIKLPVIGGCILRKK